MSEPTDKDAKVVEFPRGKPVARSYEAGEREAIRDDGEDQRIKDLRAKIQEAMTSRNYPEVSRLAIEIEGSQRQVRIELVGVAELFAPLPPIDYVLPALDICPGAPTLVAGYGYAGKTLMCQSLLLSIATGQPVFGCLAAKQGKAIHIDNEQGFRLTAERYQRLAAGLQITPDELGDRLQVAPLPPYGLDESGSEAELKRLCAGATVCLIDSYKASFRLIDENSSDARIPLDMLTRVSEATGCTFIVIHHARKPQQNAQGGVRMTIRGSGAIYDGCASVIILEGEKYKPVKLYHEKARSSGRCAEDMLLRIAEVEMPGERVMGISVLAESAPPPVSEDPGSVFDALCDRVLEMVTTNPGKAGSTYRAKAGVRVQLVVAALRQLELDGRITNEGTARAPRWVPNV